MKHRHAAKQGTSAVSQRGFAIHRRSLFAGVGSAAGIALVRPLLAEADGVVPQRFCYIHYPCGSVPGLKGEGDNASWFWFPPSGSGATYMPSPLLGLFGAVKDRIVPLDGLDLPDVDQRLDGDKHAQGIIAMGSGWMPVAMDGAPMEGDPPNAKYITVPRGTKTIDQMLLDRVPALTAPLAPGGVGPQFRSLQLCGTAKSMANQGFSCLKVISYAGNGLPLWGEGRSDVAFNNIFGSAIAPGIDPIALARQQAQQRSVLDFVAADIQRMQAVIPAGQRPKLDAHLTAIRSLEARVTAPASSSKIVKPVLAPEPTVGDHVANADEARHGALIANMLEIIRLAFLSDLTRVASITFADGNNPLRPLAFVPNANFANNGDGHSISHTGWTYDEAEAKAEVVAFYTRAAATFAANLASTPEGTGSLLDNTLGFFFTECRHGEHERRRNPCMLFGGKFLKLNAGQYFVTSPSRYTNDLWATVLTAWGAPTTVFGDPQYGAGALTGLFG